MRLFQNCFLCLRSRFDDAAVEDVWFEREGFCGGHTIHIRPDQGQRRAARVGQPALVEEGVAEAVEDERLPGR